ncbi:MAG: hypothetical protein JXA54_14205 [Candidatus Heimdallarchaeota archaeon]|nr:hypothetical protein [Candidatus Heimdallarchaeota archaeon]
MIRIKKEKGRKIRLKQILLVLSVVLSLFTLKLSSQCHSHISEIEHSIGTDYEVSSNYATYLFSELGIFPEDLIWDGIGNFNISFTKLFDLTNTGPVVLLIEFITYDDKPSSPGYEIKGTFNQNSFKSKISNDIIPPYGDEKLLQQIAIPINTTARIYGNVLEINVSCTNDYLSRQKGTLTILASSQILVGNLLIVESFGKIPIKILPNILQSYAGIIGVKFESYIQVTFENETLMKGSNCQLIFDIVYDDDVSLTMYLIDEDERVMTFSKNETSENLFSAQVKFPSRLGIHYYKIETTVYGNDLWQTEFNITFSNSKLNIIKSSSSGFGDLEIPFFQWPSVPIVGILVLFLWALPYSVLKYREWKKLPDEIDINVLEDDNTLNILDPEGLTIDDDESDDIDDSLGIMEDD